MFVLFFFKGVLKDKTSPFPKSDGGQLTHTSIYRYDGWAKEQISIDVLLFPTAIDGVRAGVDKPREGAFLRF